MINPIVFAGLQPLDQQIIRSKNLKGTLSPNKILGFVADSYKIPVEVVKSRERTGLIAEARHVTIHLIKTYFNDLPLRAIGYAVGGNHHSTVIAALEKVNDIMYTDKKFKQKVDLLKEVIENNFPPNLRPDSTIYIPYKRNANNRSGVKLGPRKKAESCRHGHQYTEENTYVRPDGSRRCRACVKIAAKLRTN